MINEETSLRLSCSRRVKQIRSHQTFCRTEKKA